MGLTAVNINNIITATVESQSMRAKVGKLTLITTLQPELPLAQSDTEHVHQVISNLLDNALNYNIHHKDQQSDILGK